MWVYKLWSEKRGDLLNGNLIVNLKNVITNIYKCLVCKEYAHHRALQTNLEEKKVQEKVSACNVDCFQLTLSDEQKRIMELHQNFNKQKSHVIQFLIHICSACISTSTSMVYLSPLSSGAKRENKTNASTNIILLFIILSKPNIILVTPAMQHPNGTVSTSNECLGWS